MIFTVSSINLGLCVVESVVGDSSGDGVVKRLKLQWIT